MDKVTEHIVSLLIRQLKHVGILESIAKITLFGSRARGDHEERSDIDIAIELKHYDKTTWHQLLSIIDSIPTLLKFDVINLDKVSNELNNKIKQDGIIIYE